MTTVQKQPYELQESFEMRQLFVLKYAPTTSGELHEALRLALIWVNFKFYGAIYPKDVMNLIQNILEFGRPKKLKLKIKIRK